MLREWLGVWQAWIWLEQPIKGRTGVVLDEAVGAVERHPGPPFKSWGLAAHSESLLAHGAELPNPG